MRTTPSVVVRAAVPAGRLGCDLRADPLTLYAVISGDAWAALRRDGVLTGRADLIDEDYTEAYAWMRAQLARRGLGDSWPVWLWARTTRRALIDQVRHAARTAPGSVLVTAQIPGERLLLSYFFAWHFVLNGGAVLRPDLTDAEIEAQLNREGDVVRTWELIFEVDLWPASGPWQAVVAELRLGDVTDAVVLRR